MIHPTLTPGALAHLAAALQLWQEAGAAFTNLPWAAPPHVVQGTRPMWAGRDTITPHGVLVASGEQSFLWMDEEGLLPENPLCVGWSPCFRDERHFDDLHHFYFMKVEIYRRLETGEDGERVLNDLVATAAGIMEKIGGVAPAVVEIAPWQLDLEIAGLEVGSYGCRPRPNGRPYFYATGLAEPRFSQALVAAGKA